MPASSNDVQKAIYVALDTALSVPVFDHVPIGQSYPFVTIDAQDVHPNDYLVQQKSLRNIYLTVWSEKRGQKEVNSIMQDIYTALHRQQLTLDAGRIILCRVTRQNSRLDADGLSYMGSMTLEILTE